MKYIVTLFVKQYIHYIPIMLQLFNENKYIFMTKIIYAVLKTKINFIKENNQKRSFEIIYMGLLFTRWYRGLTLWENFTSMYYCILHQCGT